MGNDIKNESEKSSKSGSTAGKVLGIIGNVILYIVIALALIVLVISITAKKDNDGTATIFGTQLRFVQSSSMEKCDKTDVSGYKIKSIKVKSCVFVDVIPTDEAKRDEWLKTVKVGDVLTFKYVYTTQETITHRVVGISEKESGGYIITLEGDNKSDESALLKQTIDTSDTNSTNYIIGRVTGQSYLLGLLVYAFRSTVGIICFIFVPCLVLITFQTIRIVRVVSEGKKEKVAVAQQTQANEIEELKRQLAALKEQKQSTETAQAEAPSQTPSQETDE